MRIFLPILCSALVLVFSGCTGEEPASAQPAKTQSDEEDLFKQWGPDQMPDRAGEPVQFFYWRVDQLFKEQDTNQDGKIDREEFDGYMVNFDRMDVDKDGALSKKEVIDDGITRVLPDQSPSE